MASIKGARRCGKIGGSGKSRSPYVSFSVKGDGIACASSDEGACQKRIQTAIELDDIAVIVVIAFIEDIGGGGSSGTVVSNE